MISSRFQRNFGIMAHIDAGKTTLTERILFYTGKLHKVGEVHEGTAVMDWMPQEQERGITITSAATSTYWRHDQTNFQLNIIDTPGHIDFTAEVERSLRVLDGAITVLDANAGVESQTEAVWKQANKYKLPRIVFCNKMDKLGANYDMCITSVKNKLNINPMLLQMPIGEESRFEGVIDIISLRAFYWNVNKNGINWTETSVPDYYIKKCLDVREQLIYNLVDCDDKSMSVYMKIGKLNISRLKALVRVATITGKAFPMLCGSAFKNKGIQPLINAIIMYLPSPDDIPPVYSNLYKLIRFGCQMQPMCALVFKIVSDQHMGNLVYVRVYSGVINKGDTILNSRVGKREKVCKILRMHANNRTELDLAYFGEIVALTGIKLAKTGDTLCDINSLILLSNIEFPKPVLQIAIEPKTKTDQEKLSTILDKYLLEDPTLELDVNKESGQFVLSGMGELHLEIIIDRIFREYNLNLKISRPQVAYKETIRDKHVEEYTHKKQTGGAGQFAKIKVAFEPNSSKDFIFVSEITGGAIPKEYIPAVRKGLESVLVSSPITGYPLIGIKATLVDGQYHEVDSSSLAFEIAARQCFKHAIKTCGIKLLEPIMKVKITTPLEFLGEVISDVSSRRGYVYAQQIKNDSCIISARVPLATMFKYVNCLRSLTKGRGNYSMIFYNYGIVPSNVTRNVASITNE